jgi:hypothetical protein
MIARAVSAVVLAVGVAMLAACAALMVAGALT